MAYVLILHVPMKFSLEFMPVVYPHFPCTEWELGYTCIDEVDGVGLCVAFIYLERPNAGSIVNCRVLVALYRFSVFLLKNSEI